MPSYEHRQFSIVMLLVLALVAFAFVLAGFTGPNVPQHLAAFAVVAVIIIPFVQLTTRVDQRGVSWSFTLGSPSGFIPFADIESAGVTSTRWWEGFGIHWTFAHGWLWNVSGFRGVILRKRDGAVITLGTDDPQALCNAIQAHLNRE